MRRLLWILSLSLFLLGAGPLAAADAQRVCLDFVLVAQQTQLHVKLNMLHWDGAYINGYASFEASHLRGSKLVLHKWSTAGPAAEVGKQGRAQEQGIQQHSRSANDHHHSPKHSRARG